MKKKNLQSSRQVLDSVLSYYMWGFLGPIINTSVFFQNLAVRNYSSSSFLYRLCIPLVSQFGVFHRAVKKYRAEYHQHNSES